jgi:hypothetical protein
MDDGGAHRRRDVLLLEFLLGDCHGAIVGGAGPGHIGENA